MYSSRQCTNNKHNNECLVQALDLHSTIRHDDDDDEDDEDEDMMTVTKMIMMMTIKIIVKN